MIAVMQQECRFLTGVHEIAEKRREIASCSPPYQPHPFRPCQTRWARESGRAYDEASHKHSLGRLNGGNDVTQSNVGILMRISQLAGRSSFLLCIRRYDSTCHRAYATQSIGAIPHQTLQQGQEELKNHHAERIDFSHTSTGWYAKGNHYEISTFCAHRFAGSPMAVPHNYNSTHLVQRRSARWQPGASYPNGTQGKNGEVPAPDRDRVQRDRDRLPFLLSDRICLCTFADRGEAHPR